MSDPEDDIPLALLAKKEKRREQWRTSKKRKRDTAKAEISEEELVLKRRAESKRVKNWAKKKKAQDPDGITEKARLAKRMYRANMSGYKRRWARQKDAAAKREKRRKVEKRDEKAETNKKQNTMKVKMWRMKKKTPPAPEPSPQPSVSNETGSITRGSRKKGAKVKRLMSSINSPTQKARLLTSVLHSTTPRTKNKLKELHVLADEGERLALKGLINAAHELREKRDDDSLKAKHVLKVAVAAGAKRKLSLVASAIGLDRKSAGKHMALRKTEIAFKWVTYKRNTRSDALPESTQQLVRDHYYDSGISRELPLKKEVVRVKTGPQEYTEVPKRMLEVTLSEAYEMFVKQHGNLLGQRKYEMLRPKEVILPKLSLRLVCGCLYHVNVYHLQQALNKLLINAGHKPYKSTGDLCEETMCQKNDESEFHQMTCVRRCCEMCGTELLRKKLDELGLKCCKSCEKETCEDCLVTYNSNEYVDIVDKTGTKKRRLQLVSPSKTVSEFLGVLSQKLEAFAKHRHMAYWQYLSYKDALGNLQKDEIAITLDFAENYSCVVPQEIMSMHWTQVQASLFIGVLVRHAVLELDGKESTEEEPWLVEEELIAVLDDHRHDHHAVKHCRKLFLKYLTEEQELSIRRILDFCDGAAVQFKCIDSLVDLSNHEIEHDGTSVVRTWWETAHGKGRADGAGAVVKHGASMAVVRQNELIRNAQELFLFCQENLELSGPQIRAQTNQCRVTRRKFFYVPADVIDRTSRAPYKPHKGIRSLHQVFSCGKSGRVLTREAGCCCSMCLSGEFDLCNYSNLVNTPDDITLISKDASEAPETSEEGEATIQMSSLIGDTISENDTVVIAASDELTPYYLMVAKGPASVLQKSTKDSYGNTFDAGAKVIKGNYLELLPKSRNVYYREGRKLAYFLTAWVRGICPELTKKQQTYRRKKNGRI